eukprot:gene21544-28536_t
MTDICATFSNTFQTKGNFKFKDDETAQLIIELADELGFNADQLATHYDTYASMRDLPFDIAQGNVNGFKSFLAKEINTGKENAKAKPIVMGKSPLMRRTLEDAPDKLDFPTPKRQATEASLKAAFKAAGGSYGPPTPLATTPVTAKKLVAALTPPSTATKFTGRTNLCLNQGQKSRVAKQQKAVGSKTGQKSRVVQQQKAGGSKTACTIQTLGETFFDVGAAHLHMMDTVDTKVNAIEERILDFSQAFKECMGGEAADVDKSSVDDVWVVGRIVSDCEGALNAESVLLEGSRMASEGARVRLDMSALPSVVAAQGNNPTGNTFLAKELVTHLPARATTKSRLQQGGDEEAAPLTMVVAAGPYTTTGDMLFEPLNELLQFCSEKQPDLLLLMGPFVDVEHPLIKSGTLDCTFDKIFQEQVLSRLSSWQQQNPSSRVTLMPSVRDAHALPVFPQPAMPLRASSSAAAAGHAGFASNPAAAALAASMDGAAVSSIQNPCSFAVSTHASNSVVVSACSTDVIKHLSSVEHAKVPAGQDRMAAVASHVVGQRSFYPIYPAAVGTCLDSSQASQLHLRQPPNVLVLPSDLAPFAKGAIPNSQASASETTPSKTSAVGLASTICINPGRLTKGSSGGTFALVDVTGGSASGGPSATTPVGYVGDKCDIPVYYYMPVMPSPPDKTVPSAASACTDDEPCTSLNVTNSVCFWTDVGSLLSFPYHFGLLLQVSTDASEGSRFDLFGLLAASTTSNATTPMNPHSVSGCLVVSTDAAEGSRVGPLWTASCLPTSTTSPMNPTPPLRILVVSTNASEGSCFDLFGLLAASTTSNATTPMNPHSVSGCLVVSTDASEGSRFDLLGRLAGLHHLHHDAL